MGNLISRPIHIATASSRKSIDWQTKEIFWEDLVNRCRVPKYTDESVAQYFAMTKDEQGKAKDVGGFVGGTLKGKRRKKENIVSRDLVTLDLDHAPQGFWGTFQRLYRGKAAFLYSTHSHTPENPRLRLIMPLAHTIPPEAYEPIARSIAHDLGMDYFDDTTYEASRLMYFPSCPKDGEYIFEEQTGDLLNPEAILSGYDDWHDASSWPISSRESKRTVSEIRKMEDPCLKPGVIGDFCRLYTVSAAIEKFLGEIYEQGTQANRYTYIPGTSSNGLVIYQDKYAHAFQSTDPLHGDHSYNAFDLVRLHLFGKYDREKDLDKMVTDRPSYHKMVSFIYEDDEFQKMKLDAQLENARKDFEGVEQETDDSWKELLSRDKKGKILATQKNFMLLLANLPEFKDTLWFDEFEHRVKVCGRLPWDNYGGLKDRPLSSEDYSMVNAYFVDHFDFSLSRANLIDSVLSVAMRHSKHPVRDYLDTLQWDGVARLDTLFIDFLAAPDENITRIMTRKHLVGAVKRIYEPGCHYDQVIIFTGEQGAGKSTMVKILGGDWSKPMSSKFDGRESIEQLAGAWLLESEELRGWKGAELESIKAFFSRPEDRMRPAYGMATNNYPRQCVFFATTNDRIFLNDTTGNRRFWPIHVRKSSARLSPWEDFTPYYRDQVWAEALHYYHEGEQTYLDPEQEQELLRIQYKFTDSFFADLSAAVEDYLETRLPQEWYTYTRQRRVAYFRFDAGDDMIANMRRDKVCYAEIREECLQGGKFQGRLVKTSELAAILEALPEWEKQDKAMRFGSGYGVNRGYIRRLDNLDDPGNDEL